MEYIAILDTETNWKDEIMSIGIVLAKKDTFEPFRGMYIVVDPAYKKGGMFSHVLFLENVRVSRICSYKEMVQDVLSWLEKYNVQDIFAYNARFDYSHLSELSHFQWFDIMRLAAYKDYNACIDDSMPCYKTGRLRRNYGVEAMTKLLSKNEEYKEVHNALCDAVDELKIMQYLSHPFAMYEIAKIN